MSACHDKSRKKEREIEREEINGPASEDLLMKQAVYKQAVEAAERVRGERESKTLLNKQAVQKEIYRWKEE